MIIKKKLYVKAIVERGMLGEKERWRIEGEENEMIGQIFQSDITKGDDKEEKTVEDVTCKTFYEEEEEDSRKHDIQIPQSAIFITRVAIRIQINNFIKAR